MNVYPQENGPDGLEITLELGPFPTNENNCTKWNGTYRQDENIVSIKDYRLCRRNSDEDLFIDEGEGIILDSQWIGNQLITPYRVENILYIVLNRLNGDYLEEQIITINENQSTDKIQRLKTQTIYRTMFKRIKDLS